MDPNKNIHNISTEAREELLRHMAAQRDETDEYIQYVSELEWKLKELQESTSPWEWMTFQQLQFFLSTTNQYISQLQDQRDDKLQRIKDAHNPKLIWEMYWESLEYLMGRLTESYAYENEINAEIDRRKS